MIRLLAALVLAASGIGAAHANDYPTQARVEYVFGCMQGMGAQNYDTMYACVCAVDKLAAEVPFDRYVELSSLRTLINTPGEKGGAFRDVPGGRRDLRAFDKLKATLLDSCTIKRISAAD